MRIHNVKITKRVSLLFAVLAQACSPKSPPVFKYAHSAASGPQPPGRSPDASLGGGQAEQKPDPQPGRQAQASTAAQPRSPRSAVRRSAAAMNRLRELCLCAEDHSRYPAIQRSLWHLNHLGAPLGKQMLEKQVGQVLL